MIRCPKCGERFHYADAIADDDWREIIRLLPSFGGHGRLVFEYVERFGTNPLKLRHGKVLRLLKQVRQVMDKQVFTYNRKKYSITTSGIVEALNIVVNKQFSAPLENHNYLKKVMIGISEREAKDRMRERDRAHRRLEAEGRRTEDGGRQAKDGRAEDGEAITAAEFKRRKGIADLAAGIGREMG